MYPRKIHQNIIEALQDTPVVLLNGARQTGKSALIQSLERKATYYTFDNPTVCAAVQADPFGFINSLKGPVCLDEVQRAPRIFLAIKASIDQDRTAGRFLLTSSANLTLLPQVAESLAGRMKVIGLWPLAQCEIEGKSTSMIDRLYRNDLPDRCGFQRQDFINRLLQGGYPEALGRLNNRHREAWFESYLYTVLTRDIRDLAQIDGLIELPRLMRLLGARSGKLLNAAELSRSIGIPQTTLKRYLTLLEALFLIRQVPAWASNLGKRLQKSPKLFVTDYGMMAHLQALNSSRIEDKFELPADLVEAFVHAELVKHQGWSASCTHLMHYCTYTGVEVDFVLENRQGELLGVEVKSAATISSKDFSSLRQLREVTPQQFKRGVVFYFGDQVVSFDKQLIAVPISLLWIN
jgi:predicted AAA+ superfamily ATPase